MRRRTIAIISLIIVLSMLTGCKEGQSLQKQSYSTELELPDVSLLAEDWGRYSYAYVIDNKTGVVYLQFRGNYKAGITVMLNPDGTPVTVDQIKKIRE